jgi:hypothetical protein
MAVAGALGTPLMAMPQFGGGMAFGQALGAGGGPITTQVRERTGLGFVFDTIKIPIPIIRPVAVPRPTELTMQIPNGPQASGLTGFGFGAPVPLTGVGMGVPLGMTMGVPGALGITAQGAGLVAPPVAGVSQGLAQGQLTPAQIALVQALAAQLATGAAATGASASGASASGAQTTDQQLEQLIQKCEELKRLKELKHKMEKDGQK